MSAKQVTLTVEKECNKVVKYATDDETALVTNVYLSKTFATPMPKAITITIAAAVSPAIAPATA